MLLNSSEPFPVDIERAWRWIGYKAKRNAKEVLLNNFEEGLDFLRSSAKTSTGGRPSESIWLTVDCFKSLGMMAGTEKGKEIRRYFLECERIAKQAVEVIPAQAAEIKRLELELQVLQAKQRYQDSAQGIIASTSLAMLAYLRGDGPPPVWRCWLTCGETVLHQYRFSTESVSLTPLQVVKSAVLQDTLSPS
jgi:phage anti-repressor protein